MNDLFLHLICQFYDPKLEASNEKIRKLYKSPIQYIHLLIISHQPSNFGGRGFDVQIFEKV